MFIQSFLKSIRAPIKSAVLILILTASFAALCLALNYDNYVRTNIAEIDRSFNTIAFPNTQTIKNFLPDHNLIDDDNWMDRYISEADFYLSLRQFVENRTNGKLDKREILRGVSGSVSPVLSGAFEPLEYDPEKDAPCNSAAFIATALEVEYVPKADFKYEIYKKLNYIQISGGAMDSAQYVVKFRIDEILVLNSSYKKPEFVYASAGAFTPDLQCPFENGKQYFISGTYRSVPVIQKERDNGTPLSEIYNDIDENGISSIILDGGFFGFSTSSVIKEFEVNGIATTAYTYTENELSQMCISYEGDLDALFAGRPDIAQRLENAKVNANTITVLTTDNLNSFPYFNQGKASIMEGRDFTEKEVASGESVCVVSERFATFNNLKVGDSFSVDLYNPVMRRQGINTWEMTCYHDPLNIGLHEKEITRGKLSLKIIGIYINPSNDTGDYALNDSTIFIPSKSVPVKTDLVLPEKTKDLDESEQINFIWYSSHMIPILFTAIIPNDKLDVFKAEAEAAGFGEFFIYNDQGYSSIKDTLPVIASSTRVFLIAAFVGFLAVFALYIALLPRKRHELGMLISLGAKRFEAVMRLVSEWLIIIVPALLLCFIAVTISGAPLARAALNSAMRQLQYSTDFSAGAQENAVDLLGRFNDWTNEYITTAGILLGVLVIYLITAFIVNLLQSRQSVLKLLRRRE